MSTPSPVVTQPTLPDVPPYRLVNRTDGLTVVVDTRVDVTHPKRTVALCATESEARRKAERLAKEAA